MHGSILPVTTPPGQPQGQVQPFAPGGGELFEAVRCPGGRGAGQIENINFLLFHFEFSVDTMAQDCLFLGKISKICK